jgi:hypothetical protein
MAESHLFYGFQRYTSLFFFVADFVMAIYALGAVLKLVLRSRR